VLQTGRSGKENRMISCRIAAFGKKSSKVFKKIGRLKHKNRGSAYL